MGIRFDLGYQIVELWFVTYIGLWALEAEPSLVAWICVLRLWFVVLLRCGRLPSASQLGWLGAL